MDYAIKNFSNRDLSGVENFISHFFPYTQEKLGFDKPVSVNLLSDPENAKNPLGKTAYYEPGKMKITLFVDKRHVKDILRSMAHELVHHAQNCRGEFKNGELQFFNGKNLKTSINFTIKEDLTREFENELEFERKTYTVKLNKRSIVGAGSVITKNVKKKSLALTRAPQIEIKNYKRKKK